MVKQKQNVHIYLCDPRGSDIEAVNNQTEIRE